MLFLGDDWAEAHHDIELQDARGVVLVRRRLPEGVGGLAQLHALIAEHLDDADDPGQVVVGIETDRGGWVQAMVAAGYLVYPINPQQSARYRQRHSQRQRQRQRHSTSGGRATWRRARGGDIDHGCSEELLGRANCGARDVRYIPS